MFSQKQFQRCAAALFTSGRLERVMEDRTSVFGLAAASLLSFSSLCYLTKGVCSMMMSTISDELLTIACVFSVIAMAMVSQTLMLSDNTSSTVSGKMLYVSLLSNGLRFYAEVHQIPNVSCYVPEHSWDWVYLPTAAFGIVLNIVAALSFRKRNGGFIVEEDSFPVTFLSVFACFVITGLMPRSGPCSGELQHFAYSVSFWLDAVAMMAQMWVFQKERIIARPVANAVALLVLKNVVVGIFWIAHYAVNPYDMTNRSQVYGLLISRFICVAMAVDFVYYYFKTIHMEQMEIDSIMV